MRLLKLPCLLLGLLSTLVFYSCEETGLRGDTVSTLQVRLIDGPGDYEAVLVDVVDVMIKYADGDWESLDMVNPDTYDLLELTAGVDALLGETELSSGELEQVRLILGDGNYVQIDGEMIAMKTPSAQQSGLKVKVNETIEEGVDYELTLDFDAGRSVVKAGNSGKYILKPVIRASLEALDSSPEAELGAIAGSVIPVMQYYIVAISPADDSIGTYPNDFGEFLISDLEPETYRLEIIPPDTSSLLQKTLLDLVVEPGLTLEVGEVDMEQ